MKVLRPQSLDEALDQKARYPHARPILGGTDLMVEFNKGAARPDVLLDLSRVPQLREIRHADGRLSLGAGVPYTRIIDQLTTSIALVQASRTVGSRQIRNRGTVGGNLGTASPAGDALPVLAAYDAEVVLASASGSRSLPVGDFLRGPKLTALHSEELIVAASWVPGRHAESFSKVGTRAAMVIAIASLAVVVDHDRRAVRAALGAVGPTVLRAREAERFAADALTEAGFWDDPGAPVAPDVAAEFGALIAAAAMPIDDLRGTAAYRRHACGVLGTRTLRWLCAQSPAAA